jgi:alpha-mannosidase
MVTACSYGFSCRDGDLGLSLLRAPTDPDPEADQGHHDIAFAVGRHRRLADHQGPSTAGAADTLFTPPVVVSGANPRPSPFRFEDAGSLVPSWVVPGDDHLVIRAHETDGRAGEALLLLDRPARLRLIDLRGKPIGKARRIDAHTWGIPYTAYQVVSVEVRHLG